MKKFVSLALALTLLCGCAFADVPEYVNTASDTPVIAEGFDKTYSVMVTASDEYGYSDDVWFWEYCRQALNIGFEVEHCFDRAARIPLVFASNQMPDAFLGCGFTTNELVNYGCTQGQLIDINPYIGEELMPNLSAMLAEDPALLSQVLAPDGGLYTLPGVSSIAVDSPANRAANSAMRFYVNTSWLKELNLEEPETLDEFIDMLRAFKTLGDDVVPLGGSANAKHPGALILNALGYITTDAWGLRPAMRDGQVVIPCGDREAFGEYLKAMRLMWEEGLIEQDFFTLDGTTTDGKMSLNQYGVYAQVAYLYLPDTFSEWDAVGPLTSAVHAEKQWPVGGTLSANGKTISTFKVGGFVLSTNCAEPEGLLRFADLYFDANGVNVCLEVYGPSAAMVADGMGYGITEGWEMDPDTRTFKFVENESSSDNYPYQCAKIFGIHAGQIWGNSSFNPTALQVIAGLETDPSTLGVTLDPANGDDQYRICNIAHYYPYLTNQYPTITFFDADTTLEISDLTVVVTDWVKQETAKFVTGLRSLDELDSYFNELDALGFQRLLQIYADYYAGLN